jgi:hypothetical protein
MRILRALVFAAVLLSAAPAFAQNDSPAKGGARPETPQVRNFIPNYSGIFGRFFYARPRIAWLVDDLVPVARPLGISPNYNYFDTAGRTIPDWRTWPYVSTGGRDEGPKADTTPKGESETALVDGRARWKAGDYAGALAGFKKAVANDLASGPARLHMALALLASGDEKNADKAVASAIDLVRGPDELAAIKLDELFRNAKERAKFEAKLVPSRDGTGSLTIALAQHLLGMKAKAAALLGGLKDPAGAKLAAILK